MTIDEAIKEMQATKDYLADEGMSYACVANQLGIEALKFVEDARDITAPFLARLLKGETKE